MRGNLCEPCFWSHCFQRVRYSPHPKSRAGRSPSRPRPWTGRRFSITSTRGPGGNKIAVPKFRVVPFASLLTGDDAMGPSARLITAASLSF